MAVEPEMEDAVTTLVEGDAKCKGAHPIALRPHSEAVHQADLKRVRDVREKLLEWYTEHRRKLPWRGDPPPYPTTATHTKQTGKRKAGAMDAFCVRAAPSDDSTLVDEKKPIVDNDDDGLPSAPRRVAPYETWVSEIMLQQTRVDTVVEYFLRWIDKFPTVQALAEASEEEVNALWAGLGYYRRARMLHAGAKYVMENFNGELPSSTEQLLTIPGIGPYTAGAISSIAFQNQEPLVDGNVIRVAARLRAVGADPKNKQLINFSWKVARELVEDCDRPGDLNQALMELGATMCTVQNPQCATCPVRSSCLAYEESQQRREKPGLIEYETETDAKPCELCDFSRYDEWQGQANSFEMTRYPLKAKKNDSKNEVICVSVISHRHTEDDEPAAKAKRDNPEHDWKFLMTKRPDGGLLAGQWEFVHSKVEDGDKIPAFTQRKTHMKSRLTDLFGDAAVFTAPTSNAKAKTHTLEHRQDLGELVHIFSHVKHHMGIEHLHFSEKPPLVVAIEHDIADVRWMTLTEMNQLGITTGVKKILQLVFKAAKTPAISTTSKTPKATRSSAKATTKSETQPTPRVSRKAAVEAPSKRVKTISSFFKK
ncbi:hypothetical protein Poli38472_009687 [Pythium oligandrum]|uniref:Adenine DNA glycosylase n=1 Tax=Pythium oligandrum TaxID=41045 RepID=A0A8K1CFQ3_PYTOL|nr:hypothetical protein Poli38472_009687 [Pythium oligandrum]|eukprot:TMW62194.1 hypothetical protein Poli38472_009687 [Pythium oligandrum]